MHPVATWRAPVKDRADNQDLCLKHNGGTRATKTALLSQEALQRMIFITILQVTGQQWGKVLPVMGNSLPGGNKCRELSSSPTRNETTTRRAMQKLDCIASLLCCAIISGHHVFSWGWGRNNTRDDQSNGNPTH